MLNATLSRLRCPSCAGSLALLADSKPSPTAQDIRSGYLTCQECGEAYLILAGIALLVQDTESYLQAHAKGVSRIVKDDEVPAEYRAAYLEAKAELETEHIEEDLEAERVNSLYVLNHYLRTNAKPQWWKPVSGEGSPLIDSLIREHWDHGPFARIQDWLSDLAKTRKFKSAVELGCGVGGLSSVLRPFCDFYLGADSSFASIALARHLAIGAPYPAPVRVPEDLLRGGISREVSLPAAKSADGRVDFVVTDAENPAIAPGWDLTLSLNMIDMLHDPASLPGLQAALLLKGGIAIQSAPYIWHESVAKALRERLPRELCGNSARAVEWLYREAGFEIEKSVDQLPWLFFKHLRQLEIYSVHLFAAKKMNR